jgi:CubicO group peptidase (beta-lactamase class C family)
MRERVQLVLKFLVLVFLVSLIVFIWKALPIISGYAAKVACSGIFVAGRQPDRVLQDDLSSFPMNLASCRVNYQDSSVTASVLGLGRRKAVYRWRLGATLVNGMTEEALRDEHVMRPVLQAGNPDTIDWPRGDRLRPFQWTALVRSSGGGVGDSGEPGDSGGSRAVASQVALRVDDSGKGASGLDTIQMRTAIARAFGEDGAMATGTRAVVVVWHGQLVAERYADGFDRHTRLAGWSMTKSILNALAGILVSQGKLNTGAPAPIAAWASDDRKLITIADLMHMNSGLRWWEFYGGPSDATDMLFKEANMGEYAASSSLTHSPGQVFNYSSGTANILSLILRKAIGEETYYRFPYEQLFEKTGMYSAVLEPDASGTFVGSSYCYATARDWARFGLLYLHDGTWNGRRILPEGWVKWTTTGSSYGALWWLNKEESGHRRHPRLPADCFACEGFEGQYVWVVPSKDLVVVRMALEHGHRLDPDVFLPEVIKALP